MRQHTEVGGRISEMSSQPTKYRGRDHKRREPLNHKDYPNYGEISKRRYDHGTTEHRRRHAASADRGRNGRYTQRDYPDNFRNSRPNRGQWRTYHYNEIEEEENEYYGDSRGYRGGRYDEHPKHRRTGYRYDESDKYDKSDRHDRYGRTGSSFSPHTPPTDRRSPGPRKPYNSAPPLPPPDSTDGTRPYEGSESIGKKPDQPHSNQANSKKASSARDNGHHVKARGETKAAVPVSDDDTKVTDPRIAKNLYAPRLTLELGVVTLPNVAPADATLASPALDINVHWDKIKPKLTVHEAPLERINMSMCTKRPNINSEWWLKGTHSLLMMGIPRQWHANDVLTYVMESYDRMLILDDIITEDVNADSDTIPYDPAEKKNLVRWCRSIGMQKFVLLFGNNGVAVNEIPMTYPLGVDPATCIPNTKRAAHNVAEQPDAMALMIFESEASALEFWSAMSGNCIKAYPSTIIVCPDPSGWRIYTEAMALWFNGENAIQVTPPAAKDKKNEDLLSVLTTKTTDDSAQKQKTISQLTFVSPYVANPEDAAEIARELSKISIKCMYHKPSKIMSLQFPNESLFSTLSLNHRFFTSPTGARVHCCFIRCMNKFLPLVKRTNVEHLSNAVEKSKVTPPKPSKFKPPTVGIVTVYSPQAP